MFNFLNNALGALIAVSLLFAWMAGIVLAKGFGWTLACICLFFPACYLVVEKILQQIGWV